MSALLNRVFLASLRHRPLGTALSLLAIALGVALGLAVHLIHDAALEEFGRGLRQLVGEADLQVVGPREGFDDALYLRIAARQEVAHASPVLEVQASLPGRQDTLRVLGVDVFRVAEVQSALLPVADEGAEQLAALRPGRIFLSPAAAALLALPRGGPLIVQNGVREHTLTVAGRVPGAGAGQPLAVMDIAAAQQLFDRIGRLTRIDLRLAPGIDRDEARRALAAILPAGVSVLTPETSHAQGLALSRAYRVNLGMLAVIALLTGGFLVFSTQWLSVVRRRPTFAFLRALGLTRGELRRALLAEGATLGFIGGSCGAALGYALAAVALQLAGGDLGAGYFEGLQPALRFHPWLTAAYVALGVAAGWAGSELPAREAAALVPARALRAADAGALDSRPRWAMTFVCLLAAIGLGRLPPAAGVPVAGYAAIACLLAAGVLALPGVTAGVAGLPVRGRSVLWRLALARLSAAPGQTVVAGAGVLASVALAAAMAIMVSSFRASVEDWLTRVLPADLYLQAAASSASGYLGPDEVATVAALPGVATVSPVRNVEVRLAEARPPVTVLARPIRAVGDLPLVKGRMTDLPPDDLPPAWISEAIVDLYGLRPGEVLALPLAGQSLRFRIAGVWRDYVRQHGAVVIDIDLYRALTGDLRSNDLAIHLQPDADPSVVGTAVHAALGERTVRLATPGEIRARSLEIFDRSFLVTYLMEGVAVLIGLFGVATSFAALATARRREFGMLRHLGLTQGQIGRLLAIEGALAAALGVALGLLAGAAVAWVLVEVVNRQSFHWSMDMNLPWGGLALFAVTLVGLAALAARLAGARAMRQSAVLAVREDW
ncbi:FtsX-like permease family protein [Pseudothauera hydrothermalis]|uniref:FtsX-like permease family protein n=1 Tax=Pseudothauera hydrothermalis TaxID=2184083 RepID=UPI000E08FC33|nr:FtsX-like permease family protein [Pseudothauera hydrothermalis]